MMLVVMSQSFLTNPYDKLSVWDEPCECECNVSSIVYPFDDRGYGKYTGVRYSCSDIHELGCDSLDECSHQHDICITKYGYLDSCLCNIALIECAMKSSGVGFHPCDKMEEAKAVVIQYICDAILYEPVMLGGCNDTSLIPKICYSDSIVVPKLN